MRTNARRLQPAVEAARARLYLELTIVKQLDVRAGLAQTFEERI
jgi:hypothetical protein